MPGRHIIYDRASTRRYDHTGALLAGPSVITKEGVDAYRGSELPVTGLEPNKLYQIYRPTKVIAESIKDLGSLRITRGHVFANADNPRPNDVIGSTGNDWHMDGNTAKVSVTFWPKADINHILDGRQQEFSLGYGSEVKMTPGTAPDGRHYDGVFTKMMPEHVALVPGGRVNHPANKGPLARVADSRNGDSMPNAPNNQGDIDIPEDKMEAATLLTAMALENGKDGQEVAQGIYTLIGIPLDQAQDIVFRVQNDEPEGIGDAGNKRGPGAAGSGKLYVPHNKADLPSAQKARARVRQTSNSRSHFNLTQREVHHLKGEHHGRGGFDHIAEPDGSPGGGYMHDMAEAITDDGDLSAEERKKLPDKAFGLPELKKFPLYGPDGEPSKGHATAAKGRAKECLKRQEITKGQYDRVVKKADEILGEKPEKTADTGSIMTALSKIGDKLDSLFRTKEKHSWQMKKQPKKTPRLASW